MKITASLLFFAFSKTCSSLEITWGDDRAALQKICLWDIPNTEPTQKSCLYITGSRLFTAEPKGSVCIVHDNLKDNALASAVLQVWNHLLNWENSLCRLLLSQPSVDMLLSCRLEYLHQRYALIHRSFSPLYISPALASDAQNDDSFSGLPDFIRDEAIDALLLDKHFHNASALKDPFYYNSFSGDCSYCQNIFINDKYYARFIVMLEKGEKGLTLGEEQLFSVFFSCLQQYFQNKTELLAPSPSDLLHQICHTLTDGGTVSAQLLEDTLKHAGWSKTDAYILTELQFFEESGWKSQLETTLPYLTHKLEQQWPQSCVLTKNEKLLCLVNLTRTEEVPEHAFSNFCKKLALFVRENVCTAGVSSVFRNFLQLHDSADQAAAALSIGHKESPDHWYYLYDHYRLSHILQTVSNTLSPGVCLHPALAQLRQYDRAYSAELYKTLKSYLYWGQNMSAAAEKLYIHRTTFCRRMDKIRELTGIDLDHADTILLLQLSFSLEEKMNIPEQS